MFDSLIYSLLNNRATDFCLQQLNAKGKAGITGCCPALFSAMACAFFSARKKPVLIITRGSESAEKIFTNLQTLHGNNVSLFSAHTWEKDDFLPNFSVNIERMETLTRLQSGNVDIVVAPFMAILQHTPSPQSFSSHSFKLRINEEYDLTNLLRKLVELGYERADTVEFRGEFSSRGGIVDIFPVTSDSPFRIEFFGDEICSIREFDVNTQLSTGKNELPDVFVPAARESTIKNPNGNLLDYFSVAPLIIWHEFSHTLKELARWEKETIIPGTTLATGDLFHAFQTRSKNFPRLYAQELEIDVPDVISDSNIKIETKALSLKPDKIPTGDFSQAKNYQFSLRVLAAQIREWKNENFDVILVCATDAEKQRLSELLKTETNLDESFYKIAAAVLTEGWILPECKQAVITDDEIFNRVYSQRRRARKKHHYKTREIKNVANINIGEFVVHINHGIGVFEGIKTIDLGDSKREMIVVRYADEALLYVPLEQAHLIELYVSVGECKPSLDNLGSSKWSAKKRKAEKAVLDLAAKLLESQAARAALEGHAFPTDSEWQLAFEKAFPYPETFDQLRAIDEIKRDMENSRPMDRLICGDVGFGKTEVAVRAAFKAAVAGKQVAVLAPTTILAQQHWHTFSERMADYPIRVEVLSRFVSAKNQKKIIEDLSAGNVDIIIGTHRLLSKDVRFKNIGLVVVDEEQRFGVRHKEKLKELRTLVDVLTLSATPVPRTLYQALTGARDMSTILTPPQERFPVKTMLIKRDYKIIKEAILREIARDGQVFFLHNRVQSIEGVAEKLRQIIPSARVAVAHGQMREGELSQAMEDFAERKFDVMVCTMIIESGLDMPNVNTIIIDNADMFGLADLYQLRGRVGRSTRQAYAYLIIPGDLSIDTAARHRLKAILENTALGSGYAIAMKDLEIRGAGNILGPQQSGHIASVGFSLYCKLLQHAVKVMKKGNFIEKIAKARAQAEIETDDDTPKAKIDWRKEIPKFKPVSDEVVLQLPLAGNISEDYVESPALRLDLFRRIGNARRVSEIRNFENELRDRFGKIPEETILLLRLAEIRLHAKARGIDLIEYSDGKIIFRRQGKIINPTSAFPRINPKKQIEAVNIILASLGRLSPLPGFSH